MTYLISILPFMDNFYIAYKQPNEHPEPYMIVNYIISYIRNWYYNPFQPYANVEMLTFYTPEELSKINEFLTVNLCCWLNTNIKESCDEYNIDIVLIGQDKLQLHFTPKLTELQKTINQILLIVEQKIENGEWVDKHLMEIYDAHQRDTNMQC